MWSTSPFCRLLNYRFGLLPKPAVKQQAPLYSSCGTGEGAFSLVSAPVVGVGGRRRGGGGGGGLLLFWDTWEVYTRS